MARERELSNFYCSKEWRTLRNVLINNCGNICKKCGRTFSSSKLIGHHKIALTLENYRDASISLNPDNIDVICINCHNDEENRFSSNKYNVYIVYGSPLSGKNTFVNEVFKRGDIVIDIDRIWQCISLTSAYDKPDNLKTNVFSIYNALIDNIKTRNGKWNNAYIIGGFPLKMKRERLADELGAELIYIENTKEQCIINLDNDDDRFYYKDKWLQYINDWWLNYEE